MNYFGRVLFLIFLLNLLLFSEDTYFEEAGKRFNIDPNLLKSIAKVESNFNPNAINVNSNGTLDMGIMQINSIHLPLLSKLGATKQDLFNPRININFGAFVLARCLDKHGLTVNGLNCYNGRLKENPYALKIIKQLVVFKNK